MNLEEALNKFPKKRIIVVGDVILDRFTWGNIRRVNPEQPASPLVEVTSESYTLGGAANVANNIASLSGRVTLYGVIGDDMHGNQIINECHEKEINFISFIHNQSTIVKQRLMAHNQQITRIDYGEKDLETISLQTQDSILESLRQEIKNYDLVILSDYNKHIFTYQFSQRIISLSNSLGIPIIVDPKPKNIDFFQNCTIVCPNKHEAESIAEIEYSNGSNRNEALLKISQKIATRVNSTYVTITCGEDGVFSYHHNNDSRFIPTYAKQVADVTGAGDTFAAALALGFSSGLKIHDAARLANYAAGIVVEKVGTATPSIEELSAKLISQ